MTDVEDVQQDNDQQALYWVGIGASAGGLEALRAFVRNLPNELNATYIVAQHLSPHHRSMLPEIIGRETDLEVLSIEDNVVPQPNKVYITPQDKDVEVVGDRLHLIVPSRDAGTPKPSVDRLFRTLAVQKGNRAIGIIFSGTGTDGARGVRDVRAAGGITIAQDELSAKYTGMPVAAVESGCIDLVMAPEKIGAQFATIVDSRTDLDSLKSSPVHLDGVSELIHLVHNQRRVNFRHYKPATLQRRIERRMAALGVNEIDDYVAIARSSAKEIDALFKDFLISVTAFFRDPSEFEALRSVVGKIISNKGKKDLIRIWVPGAATGEEVYSIAMIFADLLGGAEAFSSRKVQIFASDIDNDAIEIGRRGFYAETALEEVPRDFVQEYFEKVPTGYIVKKAIRERIVFSTHNLIQDPPFLNIDLISCRNLLIYFQASLQAQVLSRFHYALVSNGVLFLGRSETIAANESLFSPAENERHIYYQRPGKNKAVFNEFSGHSTTFKRQAGTKRETADVRELTAAVTRFDSLVKAIGPDGFLISADMQLRKAYGNVNPYVDVTSGSLSLGISALIKEPFGQDIRTTVPIVFRKKEARNGVAHADPNDPNRRVRVSVYPVESGPDEEMLALALIHSWEERNANAEEAATKGDSELRRQNDELRRELAIAQSNLQQTAEELETSNEELQALNEELQSSNEELQSTNEELETSNEELQSTNEELSTVNEELQVNGNELRMLNQSLSSILLNIGSPLIVVDRGLNIIHVSNASEELFQINTESELPHLSLLKRQKGFPDIVEMTNEAMISKRKIDTEVRSDEMNAVISIVPNMLESGQVNGAIILIADNTEELRRTRKELQLIFDNIPQAIFVRDQSGTILKSNVAGRKQIGADDRDVTGERFYDFLSERSAIDSAGIDRTFFESGLQRSQSIVHYEYADGAKRWLRVDRVRAKDVETGEPVVYSLADDITAEHTAAEALKVSEERLDLAVTASGVGLWDLNVQTGALWWSERCQEMLGVDDGSLTGTIEDFNSRLHPEDRDDIMEAVDKHLADGSPCEVVYRMRHSDGGHIWIEARGQATWNSDGEAVRMIGTIDDITERNRNLWALRERSGQLLLAAKLSGLGYWRVDLVEGGLYWSDLIYAIHGVTPENYSPSIESALAFYHPDDKDMVGELFTDAIENNRSFEFEARIVRPSGEIRYVKSIAQVDADQSGATTSVFGVFLDVTEDRKREAELQTAMGALARSNEELNRFSYVCSHDMKEPVRLIESMCDLLQDSEIKNNVKERDDLIARIGINTKRLGDIINSLLAYSRIDQKVEHTDVDLNQIIRDIKDSLELVISESGAKIDAENLPKVRGAHVHFTQLFQNLISNAIKFNDKPAAEIRISGSANGEHTALYVDDNGPGIPEDAREDVFAVFKRLQRRDEVDGTGLGLSICQRIAHQYGGSIVVENSAALGGARFLITLTNAKPEI